jgi:hypothetical protein
LQGAITKKKSKKKHKEYARNYTVIVNIASWKGKVRLCSFLLFLAGNGALFEITRQNKIIRSTQEEGA